MTVNFMANTPVGKRPPPLGETHVHYSTIRVKPLGGFGNMVLMGKGDSSERIHGRILCRPPSQHHQKIKREEEEVPVENRQKFGVRLNAQRIVPILPVSALVMEWRNPWEILCAKGKGDGKL